MLKQTITYEDFDGNVQTETLLFNLSKMELVELQVTDYAGKIRQIMKSNDNKEILGILKEFVEMSYGVKSADGKRFVKSEEVLNEFVTSAAYDEFLFKLMSDAELMAKFVSQLFPEKMLNELKAGGELAASQADKLPEIQEKYFKQLENDEK